MKNENVTFNEIGSEIPSPIASMVNIEKMAAEHLLSHPKPEDHVLENLAPSASETPDTMSPNPTDTLQEEPSKGFLEGLFEGEPDLDKKGNPFDPERHDPRQIINKSTGLWRKKGGYHAHNKEPQPTPRAINEPPVDPIPEEVPEPPVQVQDTPTHDECMAAAIDFVDSVVLLGTMVGPEWETIKQTIEINGKEVVIDERTRLIEAFYKYFKAKGVVDIPPSLNLGLAVGVYAIPRFTQPNTKSKWERCKNWFKLKILKRRVENGGSTAPTDSGSE